MKEVLLYIWQLPQNLIGLALVKILKANGLIRRIGNKMYPYYQTDKYSFGVSLGKYIVIGSKYIVSEKTILHESGHQVQSKILGPLYLFVIGLPSAINNLVRRKIVYNYYAFYTEAWADKIAGVKR